MTAVTRGHGKVRLSAMRRVTLTAPSMADRSVPLSAKKTDTRLALQWETWKARNSASSTEVRLLD